MNVSSPAVESDRKVAPGMINIQRVFHTDRPTRAIDVSTVIDLKVAARLAADETMHWSILANALGRPLPAMALSFGA